MVDESFEIASIFEFRPGCPNLGRATLQCDAIRWELLKIDTFREAITSDLNS